LRLTKNPSEEQVSDRRVQKTRKLLHEALMALLHEKRYDDIVVKEILDRANVGRSTFYTHFRDKDDLLVSGMLDMLRSMRTARMPPSTSGAEQLVWFSLPIFEHIDRERRAGRLWIGSRGRAILHEHLRKVLVELISRHIKSGVPSRRNTRVHIPADLLVQHVASTFVLVLNWWVERRGTLTPAQVDALFRALILPSLAAN
jgi:AcrR family transcriptional regulator